MSEDYRGMWKDLGLDLACHDALLGVLSGAYREIFLSQKNRPAGMGYFDFVMSEVHGLRIREFLDEKKPAAKSLGRIVSLLRKKSFWQPTPPWWGCVPERI